MYVLLAFHFFPPASRLVCSPSISISEWIGCRYTILFRDLYYYVCMYVCMHVSTVCMWGTVSWWFYWYIYIFVYVSTCMYICMNVCMYVCMYGRPFVVWFPGPMGSWSCEGDCYPVPWGPFPHALQCSQLSITFEICSHDDDDSSNYFYTYIQYCALYHRKTLMPQTLWEMNESFRQNMYHKIFLEYVLPWPIKTAHYFCCQKKNLLIFGSGERQSWIFLFK